MDNMYIRVEQRGVAWRSNSTKPSIERSIQYIGAYAF